MPEWNPTPKVSCKYGAPLGRGCEYDLTEEADFPIYLRRIPLNNGGYDIGGAYWGFPNDLYAYGFEDVVQFVRADSRQAAKDKIRERHPNVRFYN